MRSREAEGRPVIFFKFEMVHNINVPHSPY